jgi:hypothetical protein
MRDLSLRWDSSSVGGQMAPDSVEKEERYGYESSLFDRSWITWFRYGGRTLPDRCRCRQTAVCESTQDQSEVRCNRLVFFTRRLIQMSQPMGGHTVSGQTLVTDHTCRWLIGETCV